METYSYSVRKVPSSIRRVQSYQHYVKGRWYLIWRSMQRGSLRRLTSLKMLHHCIGASTCGQQHGTDIVSYALCVLVVSLFLVGQFPCLSRLM